MFDFMRLVSDTVKKGNKRLLVTSCVQLKDKDLVVKFELGDFNGESVAEITFSLTNSQCKTTFSLMKTEPCSSLNRLSELQIQTMACFEYFNQISQSEEIKDLFEEEARKHLKLLKVS